MELRLEQCRLRQPEDWRAQESPEATLDCDSAAVQESLILEDSLSGVSLDLSEMPQDHFPCIADELEEQAKLLEEDWACPSQPSAAAAAVAKAQQSFRPSPAALGPPALRHSALEALQQQLALKAEQSRQQQQRAMRQQEHASLTNEEQEGEATVRSSGGEEPCTPQRNSRGDSCWSESPLPGSSLDEYAEVQSPAPAKLMSLPSPAGPHNICPPPSLATGAARCLPPLPLAIDNAQRVRLGQEPTPGAWRGCGRSALCSLAPCHRAACDAAAVLPGLLAYPAGELFESGVNIEELCRVPEELLGPEGPLAFGEAEAEGEGAADCLSSGQKRARPEGQESDDGASHSQSGCGGSTSSSSPAEVSQQQQHQQQQQAAAVAAATAAVKRMRTEASSPATLAAFPLAAVTGTVLQPSPAAVAMAVAEAAAAACPRMVPVDVQPPLHLLDLEPPVPLPLPSLGSAIARNRGRPAGAPRLRPLPRIETPPAPPPVPVAHTPSKPVTRQKQHITPVAVAPVAPRTSGRKAVLLWNTESVTDPRTGAPVSEVHPGTFCTQCYALSTPVWRAGPFGHKTLCNACGVRWMKASKGSKK